MTNHAASARTERHAHGDVGAASCAAREQQVGDVGAGDEEYNRRENHQHLQALACLLLKVLNAAATGDDDDMLLGDDRGAAVFGVSLARVEELPQGHR